MQQAQSTLVESVRVTVFTGAESMSHTNTHTLTRITAGLMVSGEMNVHNQHIKFIQILA